MRRNPACLLVLLLPLTQDGGAPIPRNPLDRPDGIVARLGGRELTAEDYKRWLMAEIGLARVRDLAVDVALAREVERAGLAAKVREALRGVEGPPDLQALRTARVSVLAKARRTPDEATLRALFDRRHGVDGVKVEVRQVLVSLHATRHRLEEAGTAEPDEAAVAAAAEARAKALRAKVAEGADLGALMAESDDPEAQSLAARRAPGAGVLDGYNYQRYGTPFAEAVRALEVGVVSAPVRTSHGWHLIQVLSRKTTRFADVEAALRRELLTAEPDAYEVRALCADLLRAQGFELGR
ncbi:MAG: peptidylprolyl isomerase [Planctomycetota bacterium]